MAKKKKGELSKKEQKKLQQLLTKARKPTVIDRFSQGYVQVIIPIYCGFESPHCSVNNTLDNITALEQTFESKKISFDKGFEPLSGNRVWNLDWSMKGAKSNVILAYLKNSGVFYRIKMIQDLK
jgi:hypothetical protein